jgi:OOP family OmpA-OmpF porin
MNKKITLAALLLSSSCAFAAPGAYVGVNVGSADQEINVGSQSASESSTGVKVYGGYQVNSAFGIEAGYVRFGEASDTEDGETFGAKPSSIYAAVTGTMAVSPSLNVFGKLGVTRNKTDIFVVFDGDRFTDEKSVSTAVFGVGVQYKFSDTMSLVGEYENYGKVAKYEQANMNLKASLISVGLRVAF